MKKEKPKNNKLPNVFKVLISVGSLLLILTLFILCINGKGSIVLNSNVSNVNKVYNQLYENCLKEAKKYDKILKENSIEDIYNYITIDLDNQVLYHLYIHL